MDVSLEEILIKTSDNLGLPETMACADGTREQGTRTDRLY